MSGSETLADWLRRQWLVQEQNSYAVHDIHDCEAARPIPFPCTCGIPDRIDRDVAAKRALLAIHGPAHRCPNHLHTDVEPCRTVLLLAEPFRGEPGWREEWDLEV